MKAYFIKTYATEDKPQMTCSYPYRQWLELVAYFKANGVEFEAWSEEI